MAWLTNWLCARSVWFLLLSTLCMGLSPCYAGVDSDPIQQLPFKVETVNERLEQIDATKESRLARLYREILVDANLFAESQNNAILYKASFDTFVQDNSELVQRLADLEELPPYQPPETPRLMEVQLAQKEALNLQLTSSINQLARQINHINLRVNQIPAELEVVREQLEKVSSTKPALEPDPVMREALTWHQLAEVAYLAIREQELELEQLTTNNRLELLRRERALKIATYERRKQDNQVLRAALRERRQNRIDELVNKLSLNYQGVMESKTLFQQEYSQARAMADELIEIERNINHVIDEMMDAKATSIELTRLRIAFERQLDQETTQLTLSENQRNQYLKTQTYIAPELTQAQLNQATQLRQQYQSEKQSFPSVEGYIDALPAEQVAALNSEQHGALEQLVEIRSDLMAMLAIFQDTLVFEMAKLQSAERRRQTSALALLSLIESNLFWIANTQTVGLGSVEEFLDAMRLAFGEKAATELWTTASGRRGLILALLVSLMLSVYVHVQRKSSIAEQLQELAEPVGKVTKDSIFPTLTALLLTLVLAIIYVAPLWILFKIFDANNWQYPYSAALSEAAKELAISLFSLVLVLGLARPNGVFRAHLKWPDQPLNRVIKMLRRYVLVVMPLVALMLYLESLSDNLALQLETRFLFTIISISVSILVWFGFQAVLNQGNFSNRARRWYRLAQFALVAVPSLSVIAASSGYYYSAMVVVDKEFTTLWIAGMFWLAYLLIFRLMVIQERRLALERARAKRAEIIEQRQRELEREGSELPLSHEGEAEVEIEEVDLDKLKTQSLRMVKLLLLWGFVAASITLWRDVLTTFTWLGEVKVFGSGAGEITLLAVLTATFILVITFFVASHLPSLIELAILQRLHLERGVGYAITTLTRYLVVLIGLFKVFQMLGFEWSELQWLIAAVGVGLGFGLQEIFANMVSGLIILFERPIRPGDTVTINNMSGTISKINIRATTIVDWDMKEILIPNKTFITQDFVNWSLSDSTTRVVLPIGVVHGSDLKLVEKLLYDAAKECPNVLDMPEPVVYLMRVEAHAHIFELRVYTNETIHRLPITHRIHQLVTEKFRAQGIEIALPQLDLKWQKKPKARLPLQQDN